MSVNGETPATDRLPLNLAAGRDMVAIPGPSIIPERVLNAFARPMPDIYAGELVEVSNEILRRLPDLARTAGRGFITIGNGHAGWQMAISNTLNRGDRVLALESGFFAVVWGEQSAVSGVDVEVLPGTERDPVDPEALHDRLVADAQHEIKAVLVSHTDTSTSVRNDIASLREAIDRSGHPTLLMVDCIASMACEPYEMDAWGVDVTVAASQKGVMVPPGLAFVWAGPKALAAFEHANLRDGYFDWGPRLEPEVVYQHYAGTPPVSHLFALREAFAMMDEEGGLVARWERHHALAEAVWAAVDGWSTPDGIGFNIEAEAHRSWAVTSIQTGRIDAHELRRICLEGSGLTLGIGIGSLPDQSFRIGHMGYLNPTMLLGTIATIEATLIAMDAPIGGSGVAAAAAAIGSRLTDRVATDSS